MSNLPLIQVDDPDIQFNFDRIALALGPTAGLPVAVLADAVNVRVFAARLACTATPTITSAIGVTAITRIVAGQYRITHDRCNGPSGNLMAAASTDGGTVSGSTVSLIPVSATVTQLDVFNTSGTRIDGESVSLIGIG